MSTSLIKGLRHQLRPLRERYELFLGQHFPKKLANMRYRQAHGTDIDWEHPKNIDEKIHWIEFYGDTSEWPRLADKYAVRSYVEEKGLGDILVPLIGKWDRVEDIDWDALPEQFVMKVNNGSGDVLVCKDKSQLDRASWADKFRSLLKVKFGLSTAESHYGKIRPCIIAEQLLDSASQPIESTSLIDYKIWSFDGKPAYIWCCYNRTPHSCDVKVYDLEWNEHPEYSVDCQHYRLSDKKIPRPKSLERMLEVAAILSDGFPVVRVDLYEVGSKPYFGEMTFTPSSGLNFFYTQEFLDILGNLCKIK